MDGSWKTYQDAVSDDFSSACNILLQWKDEKNKLDCFFLNYRIYKEKALLTIISADFLLNRFSSHYFKGVKTEPRYLTSADNLLSFHRKYSKLLIIDVRKLAVEMTDDIARRVEKDLRHLKVLFFLLRVVSRQFKIYSDSMASKSDSNCISRYTIVRNGLTLENLFTCF